MTKTRRKKGRGKTKPGPYPFELRLQVVRMYLEEEYPVSFSYNQEVSPTPPLV